MGLWKSTIEAKFEPPLHKPAYTKVTLCIGLNPFKQDHYSDYRYCLVEATVTSSIRTTSNGMPIVRKPKASLIYLTGISSSDIWTCVYEW